MRKYAAIFSALALIPLFAFAKQDQASKVFKSGDNVCLVGDSITHGGFYTENIALFYITRFPDMELKFHNLGISGDSCGGILARMEDDIKPIKADIYTLMIGMNDVGRGKFSDANRAKPDHMQKVLSTREGYAKRLGEIASVLAANSRRLILFTPSIYDQTSEGETENLLGVNDELKVYGEIGREIAKKHNAIVVDMWGQMEAANAKLHQTDKKKSVISKDRVHPRDPGGYVMAAKFIEDLGEPKFVSRMEFDAAKKSLEESFNADVSGLKFDGGKISFTALEAALPYPTTKEKDEYDKVINFLPEYNREILRIKNLEAGKYSLSIDGKKVGEYDAGELSDGINLAENKKTPQYAQAREVAKLCSKHRAQASQYRGIRATEFFAKLRKYKTDEERIEAAKKIVAEGKIKNPYVFGLVKKYPELKPKQKEMEKEVLEIIKQAYAAAQPKPHAFEIAPLK